jgi:hypothetical protein
VRADEPGKLGDIPACNDAGSQKAAERVEWSSIPFSPETRACSHYSQRFNDECKTEEGQKENVEFFKA